MKKNDVIRELLLSDTLKFSCYMFSKIYDKYFVIGEHHRKICDALNRVITGDCKRLIINIAPRYGKCIAPDTRVYTTRGLINASDIREGDMLYSHDNGKLVVQRCQGIEPAHKESVRITMRSGRTIECSADHPMLTTFGYKEASTIATGERIVALRSVIEGTHEIPDAELDFVTMMIFDGSCKTMAFSKDNEVVLDVMRKACNALGFELRHRGSDRACDYAVYSNRNTASRDLLKKYGVFGKKSYDKRLPADWFTLSKRQRLRFIDLMFATDGYVQSNGSGVTLANRGLIEDIQHILSSLGIVSTICYKANKCAGAWVLTISRAETIRLLDMITFMHKRDKAEMLKSKKPVFITDSFPYEIIRQEKMTYLTHRPPYRCASNKEITRDKFIRLAETFPNLKKYIMDDFYYDRVEKVEHIGMMDLIHIGVDNTHNFIANGLVSHNTELVAKSFIAYGLALNPKSRFLHLSYSGDLAQDNSVAIKDIVKSETFQSLWPLQIKQGSDTKSRWDTEQGGGVYATSTLGQITGFGAGQVEQDGELYQFSGAIVIDDPIKPEDALSDNIREQVNRRFETTIRNRVNSRNTPIIIIMQRLHEHDLCGYLQSIEPEDWEVLSLPCITEEGKPLWEFKHTLEELLKIEQVNSFVFETQYMQNPKPLEGLMYREFKTYEVIPRNSKAKRCNYTDTADTGADYLCSICYEEHPEGNYVVDVLYTKKPMEYTEQAMAQMLAKRRTDMCIIESNNGGRAFMRNVERISREYGNNRTYFKAITQTKNKQVRIFSQSAEVNNLMIFPHDWETRWAEFANSIKSYRKEGSNAHDDSVDALTGCVEYRGYSNAINETELFQDFL